MRTNCKEVQTKVQEHILDSYTLEDLRTEVESLITWHEPKTTYHTIEYMVQCGCFLCYYGQVSDFLNGLGINESNKEYSNDKSWELYKHLIAINGEKLLK